jgi:hypothetical protein
MDYEALCSLPDDELAKRDITELNLCAANGLPGATDLDVAACLATLDEWVDLVRLAIERVWKHRARGEYSDLTGNQFRVLVMITILQRDVEVHYNPDCMTGEYDATDARDHFIHGPLYGHGGTCSSLPILYLAIGRRLGFPLYLVKAKEHLFVRWEGEGERFNIEATSRGFRPLDDHHYSSCPKPLTQGEIKERGYLRNLTSRQELACQIFQRGRCWADNLNFAEAAKAMFFAQRLYSIYRGDWVTQTMSRVICSRMRLSDLSLPWETLIDAVTPKPRTEDEAWGIRTAREDLIRIKSVRRRRAQHSVHTSLTGLPQREKTHV